ncbi:baseplate J/gp47 family protein [Endozoicomonas sp. SM1973]|uniref:Baseplate J/gp47 family protein n=1 Tax=Spartinivicinus marinus TaxID=2994442 RepID=A0A853I3D0_9GAMM|nr:baseplate J/gp47 family protein [Spartinivicinus marinus]MCX4026617.1 baseplate J/gp47 family protein [Spartinivicinus marinus]NYZ64451.1 baseplate J/gp47 family protein [Spartinivicinus marinus]
MTTEINLSQLPSPNIVEQLDYEVILQEMVDDLHKDYSAIVESDPAYKILEIAAYRELLIRLRINDAARSVMVAYARGADLDNLAALIGVERKVIQEADPKTEPPKKLILESDEILRQRIILGPEGFSTAGPKGAYRFHALAASDQVKDVHVTGKEDEPGTVYVTVQSYEGDGKPDEATLQKVTKVLNDEDIRPLTDKVVVKAVEPIQYKIEADITFYSGPDRQVVLHESEKRVKAYVKEHHYLGHDITESGILAALHVPGVQKVHLKTPANGIKVEPNRVAYCNPGDPENPEVPSDITINIVGVDL